jgi:hypothetical protein
VNTYYLQCNCQSEFWQPPDPQCPLHARWSPSPLELVALISLSAAHWNVDAAIDEAVKRLLAGPRTPMVEGALREVMIPVLERVADRVRHKQWSKAPDGAISNPAYRAWLDEFCR